MNSRQAQFRPPSAAVPPAGAVLRKSRFLPHTARGVALVLVLAFIALCTVLVVAFFASVSTEAVSERAASSENSAAQLAASAVQLVEGTISYATEPKGDTSFAWASQPGMIRTYGGAGGGPGATTQGTASDSPLAYFKLYSANNMIVNGTAACNIFTGSGTSNNVGADVPRYWDKAPALYADLNAPLLKQVSSGGGTPTTTVVFPILDPRAKDLGVEGFDFNYQLSAPVLTYVDGLVPTTPNGGVSSFSADSGARLPMPVRWMYVLKDGTMTIPDASAVPTATTVTSAAWSSTNPSLTPTAANPIVGRVAFWTDDESAKVNVNTASEGTYWDTPIANAAPAPVPVPITSAQTVANPVPDYTQPIGDVALAVLQPARNEFQRYPGHPAMTCLSTVFGNALGTYDPQNRAQFVKAFTDTVPRVTDLQAASSSSGSSSMGGSQIPFPGTGSSTGPLMVDLDRMYASLDEYNFLPSRLIQTIGSSSNGAGAYSNARILQEDVDACRFFLTAHSKAPELNLFGLPRVSMWPVWNNPSQRTNFETEMVRCSTTASSSDAHQMIVQRAQATSPTYDWSNIPRNQQVYGYLQTLMNRGIPGFGGMFSTQYGTKNADQILTEIFDYIRGTNLADNSVTNGVTATPYAGVLGNSNVGTQGQVVPININSNDGNTTHGLGRVATIGELALVLMKMDDRKDTTIAEPNNLTGTINVTGASPPITSINPTQTTLVEWALIPKLVSPMNGSVALANNLRLHFSQINLKIGGIAVGGAPYSDMYSTGSAGSWRDSVYGGLIGITSLIEGVNPGSAYPTGLMAVTGTSASLGLANGHSTTISGTVEVQIFAPASAGTSGTPLQTLQFDFGKTPGGSQTVPIPELWLNQVKDSQGNTISYNMWGGMRSSYPNYMSTRTASSASFAFPTSPGTQNTGGTGRLEGSVNHFLNGADVIRSVVPIGLMPGSSTVSVAGDIRIVALTQNDQISGTINAIPATTFGLANARAGSPSAVILPTAPNYSTLFDVCSLRGGLLARQPGWSQGMLRSTIPVSSYHDNFKPEVPVLSNSTGNAEAAVPFPGDWDNGFGLMMDGPWVNKPDEGLQPLIPNSGPSTVPYVGDYQAFSSIRSQAPALFSPNREVSSPVMFGSLPAGTSQPWRTLLFRPPDLLSTSTLHPGGANPKVRDHLLLDLFWMPVVEPYGISEPLATSGKINLNTQIMPFTYVTRTTGLRAVLKSVMVTALNPTGPVNASNTNNFAYNYKFPSLGLINHYGQAQGNPQENTTARTRLPIDNDATIAQLTGPASSNLYPEFTRPIHTAVAPNFFVSASQICDVPLIPKGATAAGIQSFWSANSLTGDNSMERPYSYIYPRVTTKSNIFTVHVLAQSLKQLPADAAARTWYENKDQVLSEYRGAYTIEKYFDPNTDDLTDANGAVQSAASDGTISTTAGLRATKWRLVGVKRFGQ